MRYEIYEEFTIANVGDTIGWKSAAGYLEGKIVRIDRKKDTASPIHKSDWVLVELDPYFARFEGETAYPNATFLRGCCRVVLAGNCFWPEAAARMLDMRR